MWWTPNRSPRRGICYGREPETLPVQRAAELEIQPPGDSWLIQDLWGQAAVGIIGGAPKCCKSWLGLDMALSVASATPCLGRFAVQAQGPALVFLAEDSLPTVRARLEGLCGHRHLDIRGLDLYVITAPSLRLDQGPDRQLLEAMLARLKPRILLLDPLVRLHRLDENSAADISKLLGFLRDCSAPTTRPSCWSTTPAKSTAPNRGKPCAAARICTPSAIPTPIWRASPIG